MYNAVQTSQCTDGETGSREHRQCLRGTDSGAELKTENKNREGLRGEKRQNEEKMRETDGIVAVTASSPQKS